MSLVDSVRESGGDVKIFSSLHVSGERKYHWFQFTENLQWCNINKRHCKQMFGPFIVFGHIY